MSKKPVRTGEENFGPIFKFGPKTPFFSRTLFGKSSQKCIWHTGIILTLREVEIR